MATHDDWARIKTALGGALYDYEIEQFENNDFAWEAANASLWDWRKFVPEYARERWDEMNEAGKLCVFLMAKQAAEHDASSPHWDE